MDIDVVGVLFWYFSLAFGPKISFNKYLNGEMTKKQCEMWKLGRILDFAIQQILEQRNNKK